MPSSRFGVQKADSAQSAEWRQRKAVIAATARSVCILMSLCDQKIYSVPVPVHVYGTGAATTASPKKTGRVCEGDQIRHHQHCQSTHAQRFTRCPTHSHTRDHTHIHIYTRTHTHTLLLSQHTCPHYGSSVPSPSSTSCALCCNWTRIRSCS